MKRVIVTGASGFIGANLTRRLLQHNHEVHLLLRPGYAPWRIKEILQDVQVHETDITDAVQLSRIVRSIRPDWVFHLAAYGAYSTQSDLQKMIHTNFMGTIHLAEACMETGFEALINTGSSSEYGFKDHAPPEEELPVPNSTYAATKASTTLFLQYLARSRSANLITLRLYSIYGPFEAPSRLIPTLIKEGQQGRLPPLVSPKIARDYVYVEDAVDACLAAANANAQPGIVYNVGSGVQTALQEVVAIARRVMNVSVEPVWGTMPERQWDTESWVSDSNKIRQELGWLPQNTFEQGFRKTLTWFLENPHFQRHYA